MRKCPYCDLYLSSKGFLKRHMAVVHNIEIVGNGEELQIILREISQIQKQIGLGMSPKFEKAFGQKLERLKRRKEQIFERL